jgi:hypothetical protein
VPVADRIALAGGEGAQGFGCHAAGAALNGRASFSKIFFRWPLIMLDFSITLITSATKQGAAK